MKKQMIRGQRHAEVAAADVGKRVRKAMIDSDGTRPENLPLSSDINEVRKGLKETARELTQLDSKRGKALPAADKK